MKSALTHIGPIKTKEGFNKFADLIEGAAERFPFGVEVAGIGVLGRHYAENREEEAATN